MTLARTVRALLMGIVLAVSLAVAAGTAWAADAGVSWDIPTEPPPLIDPIGASWE